MNTTNRIKTYQVARLALLRKIHCLSQNELAKRTGLSPAAISLLEKGDREPSLKSAIALCDVFTGRKEYRSNEPAIRIKLVKNLGQNNNIRSAL